jgi:uncharacterized protein YegL
MTTLSNTINTDLWSPTNVTGIVTNGSGTSSPTTWYWYQWPWVPQPIPYVPYVPYVPKVTITINSTKRPRVPIKRHGCDLLKKTTRKTKTAKETYITLLLDKSSSMRTCYKEALDAINEQIHTIKQNAKKGGQTFVSLILFGSDVEVMYENMPAEKVKPLTENDYVVGGITALRDAVLTGIELMESKQCSKRNQGFLSVLISDGQENASGTGREELRSRISELQKTKKWTFAYMLSGHSWEDVLDVAYYSSISTANINQFVTTTQGILTASENMKNALCSYFDARSSGNEFVEKFWKQ